MVDIVEKKQPYLFLALGHLKVHLMLTLLTLTFVGTEAHSEDHITSLRTILHLFFQVTGRASIILTRSHCWTGFRKMISEQTISTAMSNPCSVCISTCSRRLRPGRVSGEASGALPHKDENS